MKKTLTTVGLLLLYFVIAFASMFLGFLSPVTWVYYPVVAAFFSATPVLIVCKNWKKPGAIAIFTAVWVILLGAMGEISKPEVWVGYLVTVIAAEVARYFIGYEKQIASRVGYAINCLGIAGSLLPIWTRTSFYYDGAIEEMGSVEYADGLMKFANPVGLISLIVLTLAAAYLGCIVSEKLFTKKTVSESDGYKVKTA